MSRPRIVLADDHALVVEGLQRLLSDHFDVIATAGDGRALLETARSLAPDVVIADLTMPVLNGIEVTVRLKQEMPAIKVVILTMHRQEAFARRALEVGASAYVLKVAAPDELVQAVKAALAGKTYVTTELVGALTGRARAAGEAPGGPAELLTPRQREILQLLADGKTAKEIGAVLGISARTVESHKYELMKHLGVERTAELVQFAVRHGLAATDPPP